jgi:hypothetical protein
VEKHVCLSCDVYMTGAKWWTMTKIKAGIGDFGQMTRDGQVQVRYSVVERLRDRVTLCAVCTVHKEMRSTYFLV